MPSAIPIIPFGAGDGGNELRVVFLAVGEPTTTSVLVHALVHVAMLASRNEVHRSVPSVMSPSYMVPIVAIAK